LVSAPLCAWGDKGHRTVSALALRSLPAEPRRWFTGQESVVADHASDPDHWKQDRKEGPRHFLNVEPYGGQEQVPHALEDAQAKLRGDFYRRGVLPWIIQDRWRDLVDAFKTGDAARIAMATAILGHYIADAHVPLHTTENFDGQATDQKGVHSRWETGLVERYLQPDELTVLPAKSDAAFLDQPWTWLQTSHSRVSQLLQDDQVADRTTPTDDGRKRRTQAYWTMFWAKQGPVVTQQLQDAGQHLGDAILNAWIAAGKPPAIVNPSH
jgi:hypothetical protein